MITLEETYHASDYETWFAYWKQCRVATVYFKFAPGYTGEDNPHHQANRQSWKVPAGLRCEEDKDKREH